MSQTKDDFGDASEPASSTRNVLRKARMARYGGESMPGPETRKVTMTELPAPERGAKPKRIRGRR